ncbi:hypothetical protein ScPMuIL_017356 [Solemya velum]
MLFSQNDKFKEEWTRILDIAKCKIFYKLMAHGKGEKNTIDVVVTDVSCTKSLLRKSKQQKIPVVSTEWVIQSLINGYQVGYDTPHVTDMTFTRKNNKHQFSYNVIMINFVVICKCMFSIVP